MLGERLKNLRKAQKLTQSDVATKLKISASAVGMYEQGRRDPDTDILKEFAKLYNVPTDYLLGLTDDPSPYPKTNNSSRPSNEEKELTDFGKLFKKFIDILKDERGALPKIDLLDSEKELLTKELNNIVESETHAPTQHLPPIQTIAAHRTDGPMDELPAEARKSVDEFIDFVYKKYGGKDKT